MFLCALRPGGEPLGKADLFGPIARLRAAGSGAMESLSEGPFTALTLETGAGATRAAIARVGDLVGVGIVRLDNRAEMAGLARRGLSAEASDLVVALAALDGGGEAAVARFVGDFAFVAWDARAQKLLAVRDALGVKPLFHRSEPGLQLFASHVGPLHVEDDFDRAFIADFLLGQPDPGTATIWRSVRALAAGTYLRIRGTRAASVRHWDPAALAAEEPMRAVDAADALRALLGQAVASRMGSGDDTWAQLSGGLDSSSVVCMAARGGHRLAGTLSLVDGMAGADERRWVRLVMEQVGGRNEEMVAPAPWEDDGEAPPLTDEPTGLYPFWARERRTARLLRATGARVVFSGFGADHYLTGNLHFVGDLVARGRLGDATRELAAWATVHRQSFWGLLRQHVVVPHLPAALQARFGAGMRPPRWIAAGLTAAEGVPDRLRLARIPAATPGSRYAASLVRNLADVPRAVDNPSAPGPADVRYPFLHRPLVELGLRMPARLHARPGQSKWVLREAMRGVLPEAIRSRSGKGTIDTRILETLQRRGARLERMLADPVLAELGCVDAGELRAAVDAARRGVPGNTVFLMSALALETWLSVRSGRWERMEHPSASAA